MVNMKKNVLKKIVSVFLLSCSIFCAGCAADQDDDKYMDGQRFEVEEEKVFYTDEQKREYTEKIFFLVEDLLYSQKGLILSDEQKESAKAEIFEDVVPIFEENEIREEELEKIFALKLNFVAPADICKSYTDCVNIVGSERTGGIVYGVLGKWYDYKIEQSSQKYDKYGYSRYLEDMQRYQRQKKELESDIGKENISSVIGMANFICISTDKTGALEGGGLDLFLGDKTDGFILSVLREQIKGLQSSQMSAKQWGIATRIACEIILLDSNYDKQIDELMREEWRALEENIHIAEELGESIPAFLDLCSAAVKKMSAEDIGRLRAASGDARISIMCSAISKCENEFLAWAEEIEKICLSTEREAEAIEALGKTDEFESYKAARRDISAAEVFEYIKICGASSESEVSRAVEDLRKAAEDLAFGMAPYFTFAVCTSGGSVND